MTHHSDVEELIAEARRYTVIDRISREPVVAMLGRLTDVLDSVYADSLTGQAMHAQWQERAENLETAIRSALSFESVLPPIATTPRKILEDAL